MFERLWLITPLLGAALLFGGCSGDDDDKPEPTATDASAIPAVTSPAGAANSPTAVATALSSSRTPTLPDAIAAEPCTVLTDDEVKAATGGTVVSAQGVADRVQPFCKWLLDPAGQSDPVIVTMVVASIGNTAFFDNPGATKVIVNDLGDAAYVVPATGAGNASTVTLWVKNGPETLQIQVQSLDPRIGTDAAFRESYNTRAREITEAVAKIAITRI